MTLQTLLIKEKSSKSKLKLLHLAVENLQYHLIDESTLFIS